jgi:hypothetical protein
MPRTVNVVLTGIVLFLWSLPFIEGQTNALAAQKAIPDADTYISKKKKERKVNFGSSDVVQVDAKRGILIHFPLDIPEGSVIKKAKLYLYHANDQKGKVSIHRMLVGWEELQATYLAPCEGCEPWDSGWADGNYVQEPTDTRNVRKKPDWYVWDVTSDVRLFVSGVANHGWYLKAPKKKTLIFHSRESGNIPYLKIKMTSPGITLDITAPREGDTISRPDVMVQGIFSNSKGNETGITVNGNTALVHQDQFIANHLPLVEGENTITATATDSEGQTATASIEVSAETTTPCIILSVDQDSGVPPLAATLKIEGKGLTVSETSLTWTGPGSVEIEQVTETEYEATMTVEGIYFFTAEAIDTAAENHTDRVAILLMDQARLVELLKAKWQDLTSALEQGNIDRAVGHFVEPKQADYEELFSLFAEKGALPAWVEKMKQGIELEGISGTRATFNWEVTDDVLGSFDAEVTFVNEGGQWRIWGY